MKYLITLLFAALTLNAVGQTNPNYNPDYDADGFISVNDVLGVLSTFGDTWDSGDVIVGCTYPSAVEYNPSANVDDGSCTFPVDCAGVINGTSVVDECGVCGGDNSTCADCAGVANGTSVLDDCGVCGGDGIAEGTCDCDGNDFTVYYDAPDCEGSLIQTTLVNDFCGTVPCGTSYQELTGYSDPYTEDSPFILTPTIGTYLFYGSFEIQNGAEIMLTLDDGGTFSLLDIPNPNIEETGGGMYDYFECCEMGEDYPWCYDFDCSNPPVSSLTIVGSNGAEVVIEVGGDPNPSENINGLFNDVEWVTLISTNAKVHLDNGIIVSYYCADEAITDVCGNCNSDINNDNICDELQDYDCCGVLGGEGDTCDGVCDACDDNSSCVDDCGVPNGPGAIYECGCADIPEGDCDCDSNQLDDCGVCGGDSLSCVGCDGIVGCTYPAAVEYNPSANVDDGSCTFLPDCAGVINGTSVVDECGICGGDNSTCAGCDGVANSGIVVDECGICGGDGNSLDECGVCGGDNSSCTDCLGVLNGDGLVSHEGYDYSTVQIGDQCWFSENCRYLPEVTLGMSTSSPKYYVYGYEGTDVEAAKATANYEGFGVLYNWPAVMTEGICPSGWHISELSDYTELKSLLGLGVDGINAGRKMRETGTEYWEDVTGYSPNNCATNSSGWSGRGGGQFNGGFGALGVWGDYWLSNNGNNGAAYCFTVERECTTYEFGNQHSMGYSARCV
ncbi:fibrobacter succinogenes major paralogous domain-containing protein, partial [Flavobacteriales bacterium]|nr:fibrobacter succinogenes major paralogous domain-containing protein [Flavobacteriales bacterium]